MDVDRLKTRGYEVIDTATPKVSKYGNIKKVVDGIKFDSKKEAKRWGELKEYMQNGLISNLERQIKFELNEGGTFSYKYIADFVYMNLLNQKIVEDCKGFKTAVYKKKKKLMKKIYNIEILET